MFVGEVHIHVGAKKKKKWIKMIAVYCILTTIAPIVEPSHQWRGSLSLCLITVLSYRPVEFSRKTLPPNHTAERRDESPSVAETEELCCEDGLLAFI